jgi:hypothetical protein
MTQILHRISKLNSAQISMICVICVRFKLLYLKSKIKAKTRSQYCTRKVFRVPEPDEGLSSDKVSESMDEFHSKLKNF